MPARMLIFSPNDLMRLLTHYTDGKIPLDAEVKFVGPSKKLNRYISFICESKEWENEDPINVRYEGRKVASWDEKGAPVIWGDSPEAPKHT